MDSFYIILVARFQLGETLSIFQEKLEPYIFDLNKSSLFKDPPVFFNILYIFYIPILRFLFGAKTKVKKENLKKRKQYHELGP